MNELQEYKNYGSYEDRADAARRREVVSDSTKVYLKIGLLGVLIIVVVIFSVGLAVVLSK
jgi:hypothetical protein